MDRNVISDKRGSGKGPEIPNIIRDILTTMGLSSKCRTIPDYGEQAGWGVYRFQKADGGDAPVPVLLFEHRAKTVADAKRRVSGVSNCIAIFHLKSNYSMFFKSGADSTVFGLDSGDACEQIQATLSSADFASADSEMMARISIKRTIANIPFTTRNFNNRGIFSTHYLKNRLFAESGAEQDGLDAAWEGDADKTLGLLGWNDLKERNGVYRSRVFPLASVVVVDRGQDFGMQRSADDVAPSYRAVAELKNAPWVMLTDGMTWRLYTSRVSASTTNYFEISLEVKKAVILRYLAAMFGAASYVVKDGKAGIDVIFDEGKNYVQELEENLADRILKPDGIFVDLVKGILDHDGKRRYPEEDLKDAKKTALKIMYRVWFLLYAESRDLLPARDKMYAPLSLTSLRNSLDGMGERPEDHDCYGRVKKLFVGIRKGSPKHNLPQYNGDLFKQDPEIDGKEIRNEHFVRALRGLFEKDGEPMDYASLGVRHLGHIYETLMEFVVRQADRDLMLLEDKKGVREVTSRAESTYSYKKNQLYIISKAGAMSRKSSGSYYTPDEMVTFLVRRGLEQIFREREEQMPGDMARYRTERTDENRNACMDRLLDIQVLDPAMGSGHFLVEALNQITRWATVMLDRYPDHPLLAEMEMDVRLVLSTQEQKGVKINRSLLTPDVLLKRRIMKRCIFGVDINPLAVELARVSLWLDSFAIGVPLTYLNHHIKAGDATIGAWRSDIGDSKGEILDVWMETTNRIGGMMERVSRSADVTIDQVRASEDAHGEYETEMESNRTGLDVYCATQIDSTVIPKNARKNAAGYIRRFTGQSSVDDDMQHVLARTRELRGQYNFFHWEIGLMDAFTDTRRGFDLIVGNPPWDKTKPSDDEFFTPYYPAFRSLKPKTKKTEKINEILRDRKVKAEYDKYLLSYKEMSAFYGTYEQQGDGDRDLWQLIFERMFRLVGSDGIISVLVPSQFLSNTGTTEMRKRILDMDVLQMYVFENRKKIFPIDSRYRFMLLTARNRPGADMFQAGFYLHHLSSLGADGPEGKKFHLVSKQDIRRISPDTLQIPETGSKEFEILVKLSGGDTMGSESNDGWGIAFSSGFHKTNDAGLLKDGGRGWPVLEGKSMHQFNHRFARPEFVATMSAGLQREEQKRVYGKRCRDFYHSFRLAFRNISRSTDMRTIIASIMPPQRFHTHSLNSIVLTRNRIFEHSNDYNRRTAYLCGVLNSMTFDFAARARIQVNATTIIKNISLPSSLHRDEIAELAAKLSVGTEEFEGFADSLRVGNVRLTPPERIRTTVRLDALVAHAYDLTRDEYRIVLDSFKFSENTTLLEAESADLNDNKTLRQFYGEVRKLAPVYYDEIVEGGP